jgi:SagB-type dehydrogenase family enzyme
MHKLVLIFGPIAIYLISLLIRAASGKGPTRHGFNVELAVLLSLYFLATAGLGVFWVANQQLPPFDLHYLFGYATFGLVVAHLALNARIVLSYVRKKKARAMWAGRPLARDVAGKAVAALALAAAAFYLGMRAGSPKLAAIPEGAADAHLTGVAQYHAISTHTREGVILRSPSVAWDLPVARYIDRPGRPRVELPRPDIGRGSERPIGEALSAIAVERGARFNRDDLSVLLWSAAGITERRGGYDLRASASSGALFPTEIYVLAFNIEGIEPGTYAYAPDAHALIDLGAPPRAEAAFGLDPDDPPALALVATGVFRRTGQKYRDRAYRYVVADAGHAIGNAIVAAADLGLATRLVHRFDEAAVGRAVGVDNRSEGVVGVLAMTKSRRSEVAPTDSLFEPAALVEPEELELGATALAHLATSMTFLDPGLPAGGRIDMAAPPDAPARVLSLIGSRRSARNFGPGSLALDHVSAVLGLAAGPRPLASHATRVHLVANRVHGLEPGAYRYDGGARALSPTRKGDLAAEVGRAALDQDVIREAPSVMVITVDRRALRAEGARGYRHAFLEAGIIGARLYLAVGARGLGGCAVGAFYDEEAAHALGINIEEQWPLHFFGFGEVAQTSP